jgi:hypothetical protein
VLLGEGDPHHGLHVALPGQAVTLCGRRVADLELFPVAQRLYGFDCDPCWRRRLTDQLVEPWRRLHLLTHEAALIGADAEVLAALELANAECMKRLGFQSEATA